MPIILFSNSYCTIQNCDRNNAPAHELSCYWKFIKPICKICKRYWCVVKWLYLCDIDTDALWEETLRVSRMIQSMPAKLHVTVVTIRFFMVVCFEWKITVFESVSRRVVQTRSVDSGYFGSYESLLHAFWFRDLMNWFVRSLFNIEWTTFSLVRNSCAWSLFTKSLRSKNFHHFQVHAFAGIFHSKRTHSHNTMYKFARSEHGETETEEQEERSKKRR